MGKVALVFLVVTTMITFIKAVNYNKKMYERIPRLDNRDADYAAVLDTLPGVSNMGNCAGKCSTKPSCHCLRLHKGACTLYRHCPQPTGHLTGVMYYSSVGVVGHNGSCTDDVLCGFEGALCFHGQCLCEMGLYFSPTRYQCLKVCEDLGDEMVIYKGVSIVGHNIRRYTGVSALDCLRRCVEETSFICRTVDILDTGYCQLQEVGFLDVPASQRSYEDPGWSMGHRNCK